MQLNEAVSKRLTEFLSERNMTQYQLFYEKRCAEINDRGTLSTVRMNL